MIYALLIASFIGCNKEDEGNAFAPIVSIRKSDSGDQLLWHGRPFYIKGGAAHPAYLKELRNAGGNTARIYDTINLKRTLDEAHELGLAIVVDIPLPEYKNFSNYFEEDEYFLPMKKNVERLVRQHKDHPALLYWNLGNELFYPYFYKNTNFFENFNSLIDLIHEIDPNHPVTTVTIGVNRVRILSIHRKSPQLDFISSNSFGSLSEFSERIKPLSPLWSGPHVISEWGTNGAWESKITSWKAPIEETSTKKAEQIRQRHKDYIEPLKEQNSLGSFVFYWGKKNEHTPTWFSLFGKNKKKSQAVFELSNIWNNTQLEYDGPQLDYILLNQKGAPQNIILEPNSIAEAEIFYPENISVDYTVEWELRHESWFNETESSVVEEIIFNTENDKTNFRTPKKEGPYRLFLYLTNDTEYFATANIPFYILNPENGE